MSLWTWVCLSNAIFDGLLAGIAANFLILRSSRDNSSKVPTGVLALAAAVVFTLLWTVKLAVLVLGNFGLESLFGVLRLFYLDLVIGVPIFGVLLLSSHLWLARKGEQKGRSLVLTTVGSICLLPALFGFYSSFVEPKRLTVERSRISVDQSRRGDNSIRIAVLSDLQTDGVSDYERDAVRRLMALRPDLVLISGDIYQGDSYNPRDLSQLKALLSQIHAPGGVYFTYGDVDSYEEVKAVFRNTDVRVLENEIDTVRVRDRTISIAGLELNYDTRESMKLISKAQEEPGNEDIRILLAHRPDPVNLLNEKSRVDLVVAGHTHGGQVQLPLIGPIVKFTSVSRKVAGGGLHKLRSSNLIYVSRGVGMERAQAPPIRFGAKPEISLLTLEDDVGGRQ